jgi:biofilm PGA synthesis protein PgaD
VTPAVRELHPVPSPTSGLAPVIERPDLQHLRQRLGWSLVTVIAWAAWFYLWLPLVSALAWVVGVRIFVVQILLPDTRPYLASLGLYAAMFAFAAAVLLSWSLYNQHRFGGLDRRRPILPVTAEQLTGDFGVDLSTLACAQRGQIVVLHFDGAGGVEKLEVRRWAGSLEREAG